MRNKVRSWRMFDYIIVRGPFQSPVVKKVVFGIAITNYFYGVCHLLYLIATNNKSNLIISHFRLLSFTKNFQVK